MKKYKIPERKTSKKNYRKIQEKLKEDKVLLDYDVEEMKYLSTPIGKATYAHPPENPNIVLLDNIESEDSDEYTYSYTSEDTSVASEDPFQLKNRQDNIEIKETFIPTSEDTSDASETDEEEVQETQPRKKVHWRDRIKCQICGGEYTRSAVSAHRGTKKHQIYAQANKKFLSILQGD